MQTDGNGSGAYMHSGIRGGPHVGALRRCSFANTESYSRSITEHLPKAHLLVSHTDRSLRWPSFRPFCNCCGLSFSVRSADKTHTLADRRERRVPETAFWPRHVKIRLGRSSYGKF